MDNEKVPVPGKKLPGKSKIVRVINALESIFEDPNVPASLRLQALNIALETLKMRPIPRRKTDKEKLVIESLKRGQKKTPQKRSTES